MPQIYVTQCFPMLRKTDLTKSNLKGKASTRTPAAKRTRTRPNLAIHPVESDADYEVKAVFHVNSRGRRLNW